MLPNKMKQFLLFLDALKLSGEISDVSLPELKRKWEGFRAGDMIGERQIDLGQEPIEFGFKAGGWFQKGRRNYGATAIGANIYRYVGAYQSDTDGRVTTVEIVMRGRIMEMGSTSQKAGDDTEQEYKITCDAYKETVNGSVDIDIDLETGRFVVDGVDRQAAINTALGADPIGGTLAAITG